MSKIIDPIVGYWYWAMDRGAWWSKGLAFGLPVLVVAVAGFALLRGGDDADVRAADSLAPLVTPTATSSAGANATPPPAMTSLVPGNRYTIEPGDNPTIIADKLGVPEPARDLWIRELLALNGVEATTLQVGDVLVVPPIDSR